MKYFLITLVLLGIGCTPEEPVKLTRGDLILVELFVECMDRRYEKGDSEAEAGKYCDRKLDRGEL